MSAQSCKKCNRQILHLNDDYCERCSSVDTLRREHERGRHAGGMGKHIESDARRMGIWCPSCPADAPVTP